MYGTGRGRELGYHSYVEKFFESTIRSSIFSVSKGVLSVDLDGNTPRAAFKYASSIANLISACSIISQTRLKQSISYAMSYHSVL